MKSQYSFPSLHHLTEPEVYKKLEVSPEGLTEEEAAKRLKRHGPNAIPAKKRRGTWEIFAHQFKGALILILFSALLVSAIFGEYGDAIIVAAAILVNAFFGFLQEHKAERAFEVLRKTLTYTVKLKRDGAIKTVASEMLVPGDIVILTAGDRVPGDGRLIKTNNLYINEASLTGESEPAVKTYWPLPFETAQFDQTNRAWSGTVVTSGNGELAVAETGKQSFMGQIAEVIAGNEEAPSPLAKKLERFGRMLGGVIVGIALLILVIGLWAGKDFEEMLLTSVAVAVAAVPEGLAITVTAILAIGMQRILKQKALVRRLSAAETLGGTTVICVDKTGTLTEGLMEVERIETASGHTGVSGSQVEEKSRELVKALEVGVLCADAYEEDDPHLGNLVVRGTSVDQALYRAALHSGIDIKQLRAKYPRLEELPFSSDSKYMITVHKEDGAPGYELFVKGAPERIAPFVKQVYHNGSIKPLFPEEMENINERTEKLSKAGFRVLMAGFQRVENKQDGADLQKMLEGGIVFVSLYGLRDPIRKNVKDALSQAKKAGIRVLMLTGDHKFTAFKIGTELGLVKDQNQIIEGGAFAKSSEEQRAEILEKATVFARVSPGDKLALVEALKAQGEVVAMTGDGVNDAPALARADIGIALGSGTDLAKETADLVLMDNNFSVITSAIREGRIIFNNIRTVILYFLSDSFSAIVAIIAAFILRIPIPFSAAQLLWINIITDGLPAFALTREPPRDGIMNDPPISPNTSIINRKMRLLIAAISGFTGLAVAGLFWFFYVRDGLMVARTVAFSALALDSLVYVYSIRDLTRPLSSSRLSKNLWLLCSVIAGFALQLLALYTPVFSRFLKLAHIGWFEWSMIILETAFIVFIIEGIKIFYRVFSKPVDRG